MHVELITPAAEPAVSLATAKNFLRVEHSADDDLITSLVTAAVGWVEGHTNLALVSSTWKQYETNFQEFEIYKWPVTSISSITYLDNDGARQTLSSDVYELGKGLSGVRLNYDQSWPSYRSDEQAIEITFVAGYEDAASVPAQIVSAILVHVGWAYETRRAQEKFPEQVLRSLLNNYCVRYAF